jgi:molybdopterin converting factor small subunit
MSRIYQISWYGMLAERRGLAEERVSSPAATPMQLYSDLDAEHRLGLAAKDLRAAVNDEFAAWDRPLVDGDRIAFLPPMSGG